MIRRIHRAPDLPAMPVTLRTGGLALALFLTLLVALPLAGAAAPKSLLALAGIFYKAGALVFGGGHVVLPLLRDALVPQGWLSDDTFLAGYGVAQASARMGYSLDVATVLFSAPVRHCPGRDWKCRTLAKS